jgi:radical SAM modification target selenobiotic family peptide
MEMQQLKKILAGLSLAGLIAGSGPTVAAAASHGKSG